MRRVHVTKKEFEDVLYFSISMGALSESNLDASYRLGKKFRAISTEGEKPTNVPFHLRSLDREEETVILEEDEWQLLKKRLTESLPNFSASSAEVYKGLLEKVKAAEEFELKVEEEEPEPSEPSEEN